MKKKMVGKKSYYGLTVRRHIIMRSQHNANSLDRVRVFCKERKLIDVLGKYCR